MMSKLFCLSRERGGAGAGSHTMLIEASSAGPAASIKLTMKNSVLLKVLCLHPLRQENIISPQVSHLDI